MILRAVSAVHSAPCSVRKTVSCGSALNAAKKFRSCRSIPGLTTRVFRRLRFTVAIAIAHALEIGREEVVAVSDGSNLGRRSLIKIPALAGILFFYLFLSGEKLERETNNPVSILPYLFRYFYAVKINILVSEARGPSRAAL